jgi:hypothetical protein
MRRHRLLIPLAVAAVVALAATTGPAGAAVTPGQGTSTGSSSLLKVSLGQDGGVLSLRLLGDDGQASIDKKVGTPEAVSSIRPLTLSSAALPALNVEVPPVEARSTGAEKKVASPAVSLNTVASSGSLNPAVVSAIVDAAGARAGLSSELANLGVVGGLLSLDELSASLGANATPENSNALRGVEVGNLTVLDLGALLQGLGIPLAELPLGTATALLDSLGVPVGDLDPSNIPGLVTQLNGAIDDAQDLLADVADQAGNTVCDNLGGPINDLNDLLGGIGGGQVPSVDCETADDAVEQVTAQLNAVIDDLQEQLAGLLGQVLNALAAQPLLTVEGVTAGLTTKAAATVQDSVADVVAEVGKVNVGGLSLPGVDVLATVDQVTALVNQVTGALSGVLGTINPALADLVKVSVLERNTDISQAGGYVTAVASLTALKATITPPANLGDIVSGLLNQTGLGQLITSAGGQVPVVESAMTSLNRALGIGSSSAAQVGDLVGAVGALAAGPSTVEVASLAQSSNFATAAAPGTPPPPSAQPTPTPTEQLPRTGAGTMPAAVALVLVAGALGLRRLVRIPNSTQ